MNITEISNTTSRKTKISACIGPMLISQYTPLTLSGASRKSLISLNSSKVGSRLVISCKVGYGKFLITETLHTSLRWLGRLGDCWFLSAMAAVSTKPGLIEKLCVAVSTIDKMT